MAQKNDFFQKKLSNTRSFKRQSSPSYTRIWILLATLLLLVAGYGIYYIFFARVNLSNVDINENVAQFSLGQEISLQGTLKADGDILTHTHTITDTVYGITNVKSKTINLGDYEGTIEATGIVEKFYQGAPIIELTALSGQKVGLSSGTTPDIVLEGSAGVYLLQAGIHFLPAFFEEFLLLNEGENGEIKISDLETDQKLSLNYFRCNPSNPDKNCKGLVNTFSNSATRSFTTANGDTYYKLNEANSRFVANGDRRGIFINDIPEETVMKFKDLIVFVNAKVMKDRVNFAAPRICQDTNEKLQTISSSSLALKQEGLVASIQGQGVAHNLDCSVQVDFSLPTKGKLLSLTTSNITTTTGNTTTGTITTGTTTTPSLSGESNTKTPDGSTSTITTPIEWNPNVAQFPLNEEK
ncbi:MAG: hypothetical protein LBU27_00650 [Candidatus Peribacteria bacterium]|jgi:hypothetical protein|nr:hypothetical protein [Candidatus Peribacteria bacterium]